MPDPITDFNTAADGFAAVLAKVTDTSLDTPCEGWKIQDLLDHVVGGAGYYANAWGGTPPSEDPDLNARYAANRAALVEAISRPGAADEMIPNPLGEGELCRGLMFGIFTSDTLIHIWDLGQAIGEDVLPDAELLERSWQNAIPMEEVLRHPGTFGPKVDVGDDATPQVQALAFFGREREVTIRVRFAPSPTGYLHVGGARAVLFNWLFARQHGGEFLLRIEDTDTQRNQPELIDDILDSIRWLGLGWDGEPVHQSDHRTRHLEVADALVAGGHAFWSAWVPPDPKKGEPPARRADDRDAGLAPGEGRALRFRVPDEGTTSFTDLVRGAVSVDHTDIEDFVLVRANGTPMFLLANAVDDADMAITHVLRGEEHVNGTPKYLLIQGAMGADRPVFAHLPILVDEQRKKLSKRKHAVAVSDSGQRGILPEAMVNYLALLGWGPPDGVEVRPIAEIVDLFRLDQVNSAPAFFDEKKLESINGDYLRALPVEEFLERVEPFLAEADRSRPVLRELAAEVQTRVRTLAEAEGYVDFLWLDEPVVDDAAWQKALLKDDRAGAMLDATICGWESSPLEVEPLKAVMEAAALSAGYVNAEGGPQLGKAQAPVRVALTGRTVGPPLFESVVTLGRERTLERLRKARAALG